MANPRKQELNDDPVEQSNAQGLDDSSSVSTGADSSTVGSGGFSRGRSEIGITERLTDILVEEGDGDLLLQRSDREDRVVQWLLALDMQVMGACRADERLKPLLKLNASNGGVAEDPLFAHLSQHFELSEVGMLARCFCIPLVSIRVGKINKQGTLLRPTATRGNLNLTLLPTSDLRLSYIGDDGDTERLFTLSSQSKCSAVAVDEISADSSGRSFLIKIPGGKVFYFWCSEKSKLLGIELLAKMKDILNRKPSIADLTGISKSRLDCFATQLRSYLVGSNAGKSSTSTDTPMPSDTTNSKSLRSRHTGSQAVKASSSYQGSLSPRSSSFKEGLPRSLSSLRNAAREKLRRHGESHLSVFDNLMVALPRSDDASSSDQSENEKPQDVKSCSMEPSSFLESLGKLAVPSNVSQKSLVPSASPLFSPHYCWCPQGASSLQFPSALQQSPTSAIDSPLLPPISSFLSSSLLNSTSPLSLADIPSLDFPALLPDPLVRLPIPSSQQIPTFTPLMCDPIVHIPVIDICSSGQGYLVSAGPTITSTIPSLHPQIVNPLIPPETDSMVEKSARETLRLLISGSSQASPQLMSVLPAVLTDTDEKRLPVATGSRGLYSGVTDVDAIANSIATIGLVSLSESSAGVGVTNIHDSYEKLDLHDELDVLLDGSTGLDSDDEVTLHFLMKEGIN